MKKWSTSSQSGIELGVELQNEGIGPIDQWDTVGGAAVRKVGNSDEPLLGLFREPTPRPNLVVNLVPDPKAFSEWSSRFPIP
jgi:hypothetical protein